MIQKPMSTCLAKYDAVSHHTTLNRNVLANYRIATKRLLSSHPSMYKTHCQTRDDRRNLRTCSDATAGGAYLWSRTGRTGRQQKQSPLRQADSDVTLAADGRHDNGVAATSPPVCLSGARCPRHPAPVRSGGCSEGADTGWRGEREGAGEGDRKGKTGNRIEELSN